MTEPSSLGLGFMGISSLSMAAIFRRIWKKLPRWKSRTIKYRVPDPYGKNLRAQLWAVEIQGVRYLTSDIQTMELLLDILNPQQPVEVFRTNWNGKVRIRTRSLDDRMERMESEVR